MSNNKTENVSEETYKALNDIKSHYISLVNNKTEVIPYIFEGKMTKVDINIPMHRIANGDAYLLVIMNRVICDDFSLQGTTSKHYSNSIEIQKTPMEEGNGATNTEIIDSLNSVQAQGSDDLIALRITNSNISNELTIKINQSELFNGDKNFVLLVGGNNVKAETEIDISYQPLLVPLSDEHTRWLLIGVAVALGVGLIVAALWYVHATPKPKYHAIPHPMHGGKRSIKCSFNGVTYKANI